MPFGVKSSVLRLPSRWRNVCGSFIIFVDWHSLADGSSPSERMSARASIAVISGTSSVMGLSGISGGGGRSARHTRSPRAPYIACIGMLDAYCRPFPLRFAPDSGFRPPLSLPLRPFRMHPVSSFSIDSLEQPRGTQGWDSASRHVVTTRLLVFRKPTSPCRFADVSWSCIVMKFGGSFCDSIRWRADVCSFFRHRGVP